PARDPRAGGDPRRLGGVHGEADGRWAACGCERSLAMNRRLWMLAFLYVAQGLPFGFFTQALPVRMRESGMSLGAIGLASLLAAPWALKALLAPLVDAHGSRRAWIIPLQLGSVVVLVVASFLPPERALVPVLIAVLFSNALAAAQDVATD